MSPSTQSIASDVLAGQAAYTPLTLRLYDFIVHRISNHVFWKCPTAHLVGLYNRHVSSNHLDIGVGTGYFLDRCRFPIPSPRVALMDLNPATLAHTARRIARYEPEQYVRNVLEPISIDAPPFDSIAMMYLLHCIPGSIAQKAVVFDHVRALLAPGGCIFGATIVQGAVSRNRAAQTLMDAYNRKGIFHNAQDNVEDLEQALTRFAQSQVTVQGSVALFWAK
jgi:SAM-dependent methyltransferase